MMRVANIIVVLAVSLLAFAQNGVELTVHNLSVNGPGTVKSQTETGVCIFCHSPHNATPKASLWNRQIPSTDYQQYTSSTYSQTNNPISQHSKLCLSCHDGTIGLGQTIATGDLNVPTPLHTQNVMGTDLRVDHPVSFSLPAKDDGEISAWLRTTPFTSPDPAVQLVDGQVECTTCHDPHVQNKDTFAFSFLVRSNENGGLCVNCHDTTRGTLSNYMQSAHASATKYSVSAGQGFSYGTVASNSCGACHTSHNGSGSGARLLRSVEESTCLTCHSSKSVTSPASPDIQAVLTSSTYKHPILSVSGSHDPAETLPVTGPRHSECEDCHNPHQAATQVQPPVAPMLQSALAGTKGISSNDGSVLNPATREYELCFKCHGPSTNKPQTKGYDLAFGRTAVRQSFALLTDPFNANSEFTSTISRHNVVQQLSSSPVPSLRTNMLSLAGAPTGPSLTSTNIYCSDCHNSDNNRRSGGSGANGAHGSSWQHILERRYELNTPPAVAGGTLGQVAYGSGISGPYALCDKCHDIDNSLLAAGQDKLFGHHQSHVVLQGIACSTCHSSHGVQGGDSAHHSRLVDPDTALVSPSADPAATDQYINTATRTCNVQCHGVTHTNTKY